MRIEIENLIRFSIGRQEDNGVCTVEIDCTCWKKKYPELTDYRLEVRSPSGIVYFPVVSHIDNVLRWKITNSDTSVSGEGRYQVVAKGVNGERKTSASSSFVIMPIMSDTTGDTPPDPSKPWVDKILEAIRDQKEHGVTSDQIEEALAKYLKENPIDGINEEELEKAVEAAMEEANESGKFKGDQGEPGPAGADGKDGSDYVLTDADKQEIAGMVNVNVDGGANIDDTTASTTTTYSSSKIDALLNEQKGANATQDEEIAKRAKDADLAAVAKSGSYNDLSNKPDIPTVPSALPNPKPLTINGQTYDGSEEVNVTVEGGGGSYTLPIASPDVLGGVKPAAKTDGMTQEIGVDAEGKLWGLPGGSSGEEVVILLDVTLEEETSRIDLMCTGETLEKIRNNLKSFHMVYKTEPPADETITSEGYICMGMGRGGVGDGFGVNSGNASNGTPSYGGKAKWGYYTVIPYQPFEISAITGGYGGETPTIAAMRRQKGDYSVEEIIKTVIWQRGNANQFFFKTDKVFGVGSRFAIALLLSN